MKIEALTPFGRGADAPLAGRTVLQIVPALSRRADARATVAVTAALVDAGARALVASDPGDFAGELQAVGGLHVPFPASDKNPLGVTLNIRRLARIIEEERVNLVHARSRSAARVAVGACRKTKRPLVTAVESEAAAAAVRVAFDAAIGEGDLVIAASYFSAERAGERFPAALARLRIVRPGLDLAELSRHAVGRLRVAKAREAWGAAPHERVVLAPSRLAPGRGQRFVIEAASILKERGLADLRFVLAGDPAKPASARELDALAAARGVGPILTRVGGAADRAAAFIAASAVVFAATEPDGIARTAIEAAGMGALVVASDVGPAREILASPPHGLPETRSGWLFPAGDAKALADALEATLILGATGREAIRSRSRARIAEFYSLERMTRDTLGVYAEALRR